jgi:hypothetical protein
MRMNQASPRKCWYMAGANHTFPSSPTHYVPYSGGGISTWTPKIKTTSRNSVKENHSKPFGGAEEGCTKKMIG